MNIELKAALFTIGGFAVLGAFFLLAAFHFVIAIFLLIAIACLTGGYAIYLSIVEQLKS